MNQDDKDIFKTLIREEITELRADIKTDVDKSIGRMISAQSAIMVLLLFIMSGAFAYTSMVSVRVSNGEDVCHEVEKKVSTVQNDMRTISSKLFEEYPESVVLEDMHDRYSAYRSPKEKRLKPE